MSTRKYARLQVDSDAIPDDDKPPQTGHTFNVWYLKWAGGDLTSRHTEQLKFRVNIKSDSGTTRGVDGKSPICIFFARGCCYRGRKCPYLHRLPNLSDMRIPTQDCFGRDKTAEYRDDMGGVGLLQKANRTLYVTGAHMNDLVQENLHKQFLEFGAIDKIRVLHAKNCAFISFRLESEAQFAKEAMDSQTLDGKDVLTVKWANDDPNPHAQQLAKRDLEQMAMETVRGLLAGELDEKEGPVQKKRGHVHVLDNSNGRSKRVEVNLANLEEKVHETLETTEPESGSGILDFSRLNALKKLSSSSPNVSSAPAKPLQVPPTTTTTASTNFLGGYSSDDDSE